MGGYVLEKLQRSEGSTFIWGGTSIWHRIVGPAGPHFGDIADKDKNYPLSLPTHFLSLELDAWVGAKTP